MQEINIYATQNTIGWKLGKKNIYNINKRLFSTKTLKGKTCFIICRCFYDQHKEYVDLS